jgi:multisubunit Na+/H+ antiporter MnhB subunit
MEWASVIGILAVTAFIVLYEWPKLKNGQKKEKIAFFLLSLIGASLAVTLVFFPDLPSPSDWIDALYKPLGKLIEK